MQNSNNHSFAELFEEISEIKMKNVSFMMQIRKNRIKTLLFVYRQIFDFPGYDEEIKVFVSKNFLDSVVNLMFNNAVIHHSYISGNIIG